MAYYINPIVQGKSNNFDLQVNFLFYLEPYPQDLYKAHGSLFIQVHQTHKVNL